MRKTFLIISTWLCLLVFTGCPYGSKFTAADEKKALLINGLEGKWKSETPGVRDIEIRHLAKNVKGYELIIPQGTLYDRQGLMPLDTLYTFYINKIAGAQIVTVRERAPEGKYFYFKFELTNTNEFTLWEVDEKKFDKQIYTTQEDFRKSIAEKLKDKSIFIEPKVFKRKP